MEDTKNHKRMVQKKEIALQIKDLLKENPQGMSITEIVKEVNINRNTAGRYLENLLMSGQVEMRRLGMAKIYILSQRVPLSAVLSISSELVIQLDRSLRVIYANEPFLNMVGTDSKDLLGKNIEYTPVALVFDETFSTFIENIKEGSSGKEWFGEIELSTKDIVLFCRIAPTVFEDGRKGVSVIFEDITQRKKAERKIEESEERYHTLVDISPDAVIIHRDGKIFFMNPAALALMGASHLDEMLGKNILDFIHPEFRGAVRENIQKDLVGDFSPPIELNMVRIDGTPIIVEGRGVKTIIGGTPAIQVAIRDITERKHTEEALLESEERYRTLAEASNDIIFVIDKDDRVEYVNGFAAELVNKPVNQIIGQPRSSLFPPDVARNQKKGLEIVFETGAPVRNEGVLEFNGQKYWFDHLLTPLKDPDNQVRSVLGISRDITERKNADIKLRDSEGKLNAILGSIPEIITMMDKDLSIIWANKPAIQYFGKDLIGMKCYEVYHQREQPCEPNACPVLMTFGDGKMHHHEYTLIDSHGEKRFFEGIANVALRDITGNPVTVLEIGQDVTDKKRSERHYVRVKSDSV
jgi:PAS domain S-box-containing protein